MVTGKPIGVAVAAARDDKVVAALGGEFWARCPCAPRAGTFALALRLHLFSSAAPLRLAHGFLGRVQGRPPSAFVPRASFKCTPRGTCRVGYP